MSWTDELTILRNLLSELYPAEADLKRLADETGIPRDRLNLQDNARNSWHDFIALVGALDKISSLLHIVTTEYPDNAALTQAAKQQIAAESSQYSSSPNFTPEPTLPFNGSNLPRRGAVIGRDDDITKVLTALGSRAWIAAITGPGGIGKTTLALEVAHRCQSHEAGDVTIPEFRGYVWTSARDKPDFRLEHVLREIANTLEPATPESNSIDLLQSRAQHLLATAPQLVVVDNAESIRDESLFRFLQHGIPDPSKVIITSRHQQPKTGEEIVPVGGLSQEESERLLRQEAKRLAIHLVADDEARIPILAAKTYGIPYVIKWVMENFSLGKPIEWILASLEDATADDIFDYVFSRSLASVDEQSRKVFRVMSVFAVPALMPAMKAVLNDVPALPERVSALVRVSLLEDNRRLIEDYRRFGLHPFSRYLAERHLDAVPDEKSRATRIMARYFVDAGQELKKGSVDCERFAEEIDNYIAAVNWFIANERPAASSTWTKVGHIAELLSECSVATKSQRSEIVASALQTSALSRYLASIKYRTRSQGSRFLKTDESSNQSLPFALAMTPVTWSSSLSHQGALTERQRIEDVEGLLSLGRRIAVVGGRGSGKSEILRFLGGYFAADSNAAQAASRAVTGEAHDWLLPFVITMRDLMKRRSLTVEEFVKELASELRDFGVSEPEQLLRESLETGNVLLLIDGLDEGPAADHDGVRVVQAISRRFPRCFVVASYRPIAHREDLELDGFVIVETQGLTDAQVQVMLEEFLGAESAASLYELLSSHHLLTMVRSPRVLGLLAEYFRSASRPLSMPALWDVTINSILSDWTETRWTRPASRRGFVIAKELLSRFALKLHKSGRRKFGIDEVFREVRVYHPPIARDRASLEYWLTHLGLFEEVTELGEFQFRVVTCQEYLAGLALATGPNATEVLLEKMDDPWWTEVCLFAASAIKRGDPEKWDVFVSAIKSDHQLRTQGSDFLERIE